MKRILGIHLLCVFLLSEENFAQQSKLTLDECYSLAEENYPLTKQRELIIKTTEYSVANLGKGYFPQFNISGQASYQSDVTKLPIKITGISIPELSKDQYKLYGEVNQGIYDGGLIEEQKKLQKANQLVEQARFETEMYKLKDRINQLFFGVLLIDGQLVQNDLLINDIQLGIDKVNAAINNGTAFKSNREELNADQLRSKQRNIELGAVRKSYLDMLGLFINKNIDENTILAKPVEITGYGPINRPELLIYDNQNKSLEYQNKLLVIKTRPKLYLFFQGGVGRPALNLLNNDFKAYYIGGIKLSWSLSAFYTLKNDKALVEINKANNNILKEIFLFNTNLTLSQQNAEIAKYKSLLTTDEEIINIRNKVKTISLAQLQNGVINSNDYLRQADAEDQARQNKLIHEIQLLMSQYNQQTTLSGKTNK